MIELARIVEHQASLASYRATQNEDRAVQLELLTETGIRTLFFVAADNKQIRDVKIDKNYKTIMDKNDYSASHQFIIKNPQAIFILYPSCRDPKQRDNAAVLDINFLEKNLKQEASIKFFYDNTQRKINWIDYQLHIEWAEVT